jgi:spore coat protein CotH
MHHRACAAILLMSLVAPLFVAAQQDEPRGKEKKKEPAKKATDPASPGGFFGPGGMVPFGPGGSGGFGGPMRQERKLVGQFDKDGDRRLNKEERAAAREFLKKEGPRGGFGRGPGGPGGRMAFGLGNLFTKPLLEALDLDKDSKLSKKELTAGIINFYNDCDKEKKGALNEQQISDGLNRILPRPGVAFAAPAGPTGGAGSPPGGLGAPAEGAPPGGPAGGGPAPGGDGPGGGFRRFGPSNFLAGAIVRRADTSKDTKLTLDEMVSALDGLLKETDKDKDGKLDETELGAAIALLTPAPGGFGPPGFGRENRDPPKPGPHVSPSEVASYPNAGLYDETALRTLFLEFENKDWEAELADFHGTDVEVPATLVVDGKKYRDVGVHFRGMSSYMGVPAGYKRSFNVAIDFADPKQRLYGYKTLNLLNSHDDASFMSTVLYSHIARQYIRAPKANFVKVVVNGESWGIYVNAQQFNKDFLRENFKTTEGARWKVTGSPGADGGLRYLGENIEEYKRRYEIKSSDDPKAWKALIALCRTLEKTPAAELEEALKPILDVDTLLWFLALDVALINNDGYWARASDYCIYMDKTEKFHIIPYDMNEAFHGAMMFGPGFGGPGRAKGPDGPGGKEPGGLAGKGPGGKEEGPAGKEAGKGGDGPPAFGFFGPGPGAAGRGMGPQGSGAELDPLVGLDDARKPLRSKLLAVPSFKARYLAHVRTIAEVWLDWKKLGPVVQQYQGLIDKEIASDTHRLSSYDAFKRAVADVPPGEGEKKPEARTVFTPGRPALSLRAFADQRREFLLNHPEIKKLAPDAR